MTETSSSPETDASDLTSIAVVLLAGGVMAVAVCDDLRQKYEWERAPHVSGELPGGTVSGRVWTLATAFLLGGVVTLLLVMTFDVYRPVAFLPLPLAAGGMWLLARRSRLQFHHLP